MVWPDQATGGVSDVLPPVATLAAREAELLLANALAAGRGSPIKQKQRARARTLQSHVRKY